MIEWRHHFDLGAPSAQFVARVSLDVLKPAPINPVLMMKMVSMPATKRFDVGR